MHELLYESRPVEDRQMHMLIAYRQGIFSATLRRVYIMTPDHDLTVDFLENTNGVFQYCSS